MEVILDTNALSEFFESNALDALLADVDRVNLPVIVLGEYRFGLQDSRKRQEREERLATLEASARILPVDVGSVLPYARLRHELKRAGKPVPANDVWIAAVAIQHGLPIVSRDRHFDVVPGVRRIGW